MLIVSEEMVGFFPINPQILCSGIGDGDNDHHRHHQQTTNLGIIIIIIFGVQGQSLSPTSNPDNHPLPLLTLGNYPIIPPQMTTANVQPPLSLVQCDSLVQCESHQRVQFIISSSSVHHQLIIS